MWVQLFGALVVGLLQPLLTSELQQLVAQVKAKVPTLVDPDGHIAIAALIPLVLSEIEALVHAKSNSFVAMIVNSILGPLAANELPALEAIVKARHPELFDAAGDVDVSAAVPIIVKAIMELVTRQHVTW